MREGAFEIFAQIGSHVNTNEIQNHKQLKLPNLEKKMSGDMADRWLPII